MPRRPPPFALDVARLGGMYAGQIHLVGTEAGVGVRNAGVMAAQGGALVLHSNGWLHSSGVLQATTDLRVHTQGDLTLAGQTQARGNVQARSAGVLTQQGQLSALGQVQLKGQQLHNRGVIDAGAHVALDAATVHNSGGQIYGERISVQAEQLTNDSASQDGTTRTGVIAARERLDIGARHILNRDGAMLLSLGSLHVGGTLDSQRQASAQAQSLTNRSALIESLGDMTLASAELHNLNDDHHTVVRRGPTTPVLYLLHQGVAYQPDELALNFGSLDQYLDEPAWRVLLPSADYPFAHYPPHIASWANPIVPGSWFLSAYAQETYGTFEEGTTLKPYPREHLIWTRLGVTPPPEAPTYDGPDCSDPLSCSSQERGRHQAHLSALSEHQTRQSQAQAALQGRVNDYNASVASRLLTNWTVIDASQTVHTAEIERSAPAQIRVGGQTR